MRSKALCAVIIIGLPKLSEKVQFGPPKICFGPKNLAKADHFVGWMRSALSGNMFTAALELECLYLAILLY
jgi:hypothetical protein